MGANNWAVCPRCTRRRAAMIEEMRARVRAEYGRVTVEEFDMLRRACAEAETATPPHTLREDYEIHGAEDGTVIAKYACSCKVCGLEAKFTYRHELDV